MIYPQASIIRNIVENCGYSSYLELGVYDGFTFEYVSRGLVRSVAVDIVDLRVVKSGKFICLSTDEFFKKNKETFDVIFIDADHTFESARKDFENAISVLNKNGIIVLHDTDPAEKKYLDKGYCGDSYRMIEYVRSMCMYDIITLPVSHCGLTLVKRVGDLRVLDF